MPDENILSLKSFGVTIRFGDTGHPYAIEVAADSFSEINAKLNKIKKILKEISSFLREQHEYQLLDKSQTAAVEHEETLKK